MGWFDFHFDRPLFLLAAIAVPVAVLLIRPFFKPVFTVKLSLGPPGGILFKPPAVTRIGAKLLLAAELAAVSLIFIAMANPVKVTLTPQYHERGADVIFVLDVSPSMAALDITEPAGGIVNRFDAARALILSFAETRPSDAVGLAAVGQDAVLLIPPTIDREAFYERLLSLRIGELGDGTALGMGLSLAGLHLRGSTAPVRACVLVTDGENNAGSVHPETAAQAVQAAGAALFVIGIGTGGEALLDYVDPETETRRRGIFDSRYDTGSLTRIAEKGNGIFLEARTGDELSRAFFRIGESAAVPVRVDTERKTESRAVFFIAASLVLLFTGTLFRHTRIF
jgi:Ca-activated chloride channel family protein